MERCGTEQECHDGWFVKYSSNDRCLNFDERFLYTSSFTCEFCCTSDNCNINVNPTDLFDLTLG
ncbi:hypothetical protein MAR_036783 [Mya arenaria]|uniref:ShKT domain-containing protein n=1 Tax=Mya arenaria TaxID=6604 RepID=A0ABY7FP65_MYAAR|nr:hypothetical protein MAR_036783 [Mya arenaria]